VNAPSAWQRLVYGRRASVRSLADFSQGLVGALSADELLPRMAQARGWVGAARAVRSTCRVASIARCLVADYQRHSVDGAVPPGFVGG
jgi:hypothetical protein